MFASRGRLAAALAAAVFLGCAGSESGSQQGSQSAAGLRAAELDSARALFNRNLKAIKDKNREAYVACYWADESLTRTGPGGPVQGYADWADSLGDDWPERFDGTNMHLTWLRPGVVYGSYRYRVRFAGADEDAVGISERVMMDTPQGWRIAVSTAFPAQKEPEEK